MLLLDMRYLFLISIFLVSGCSHWEGRSKMDLIGKFGLPTQTMNSPEGEVYQYDKCNYSSVAMPLDGPFGRMYVNTGATCKKHLFLMQNDKIVKDMGNH